MPIWKVLPYKGYYTPGGVGTVSPPGMLVLGAFKASTWRGPLLCVTLMPTAGLVPLGHPLGAIPGRPVLMTSRDHLYSWIFNSSAVFAA